MYQMNFYTTQQQKHDDLSKKRSAALINESRYYLNKSKSKWISIGFSLEKKYIPVVKLGGYKNNQNVIFTEDQWVSFLNQQGIIMGFIHSDSFGWQSMEGNGFQLHFILIKESRVIKITQEGGNCVYLAEDGINEANKLADLIQYRLDLLKSQEFSKYYNILVAGVSSKNGDILQNVYNVISPLKNLNSQNIYCVLELLNLYSDCIFEDVESFACNEFVKNCVNK